MCHVNDYKTYKMTLRYRDGERVSGRTFYNDKWVKLNEDRKKVAGGVTIASSHSPLHLFLLYLSGKSADQPTASNYFPCNRQMSLVGRSMAN